METNTKKKKVVSLGRALAIILPAEFVRNSGIKKGDVVAVTYDTILVMINPNLPGEPKDKKDEER